MSVCTRVDNAHTYKPHTNIQTMILLSMEQRQQTECYPQDESKLQLTSHQCRCSTVNESSFASRANETDEPIVALGRSKIISSMRIAGVTEQRKKKSTCRLIAKYVLHERFNDSLVCRWFSSSMVQNAHKRTQT